MSASAARTEPPISNARRPPSRRDAGAGAFGAVVGHVERGAVRECCGHGGRELAAGLEPVLLRLGERLREHEIQRGRHVAPDVGDPRRWILQVRNHELQLGLALVGPCAGETLVGDAGEAVDVRARVEQRAPLDLLGCRIVDGADEVARSRQALVRLRALRETEVGQEDVVARRDQDVAGLDVPMHQPAEMSSVERACGLADDPRGAGRIERPFALEQGVEIRRLDEPHRDVEVAVRLAGVEHRDDVGVLDPCGDAPLALEPLPKVGVLHQFERQQLESVPPSEP